MDKLNGEPHTNGYNYDSGCTELNKKIKEWLKWDMNENTKNEIISLCEKCDWNSLKKLLIGRLSFGTAGLRGVMRAGFNSMNDLVIIQTAQGLLQYILKCYPKQEDRTKGIVLGYDGRYNSKRFAELTAAIFLNANVPVWLYSKMVATPFIPFAINQKKCLAGVMVTASHNPKEDNGYKVYWTNSAQIISPHDKNIEKSILDHLIPQSSSWQNLDILLTSPYFKDPFDEMYNLYYKLLMKNIPKDYITKYNSTANDLQFVYTAMHGVGYNYVEQAFKEAGLRPLIPVIEQRDPDPDFPTVKFPNPEEGASSLELSFELAKKSGCNCILANDPDADRLACAEIDLETGKWKVFTGNELGALLSWWALQCYKEIHVGENLNDCYMLASTVSSKIIRAIANVEGFNFIETLTGFKWMGNRSVELMAEGKQVLFAFEEAIGFMFSPTVLDKDGVSAACHLATMYAYIQKTSGQTLKQKLDTIYQTYGYHYTLNSYYICYDKKKIETIFERIRNIDEKNKYPSSVANGKYPISSIRDLTTGIDTSQPDNKAILPCSKSSQMITFSFENGVVVTLRTSGTEPKIKYYTEMCAKPEEKNWSELRETLLEIVEAVVEELLQPVKNQLIAKE